jgi:hypothetical protein
LFVRKGFCTHAGVRCLIVQYKMGEKVKGLTALFKTWYYIGKAQYNPVRLPLGSCTGLDRAFPI